MMPASGEAGLKAGDGCGARQNTYADTEYVGPRRRDARDPRGRRWTHSWTPTSTLYIAIGEWESAAQFSLAAQA